MVVRERRQHLDPALIQLVARERPFDGLDLRRVDRRVLHVARVAARILARDLAVGKHADGVADA
jgi:hypothetical protein